MKPSVDVGFSKNFIFAHEKMKTSSKNIVSKCSMHTRPYI